MKASQSLACVAGLLGSCLSWVHAQVVVYERAVLGTTGTSGGGGLAADDMFYSGWRFEVTGGPVTTTRIGGHFHPGSGSIFGALVRLSDANDNPDAFNLTSPDVIGTTLIDTPSAGCSCDDSGPLAVTLTDGWYLVIFGAGRFGATGAGPGLVAQAASTAVAGAQLNVTYRQATSPFGEGGPFLQGSVGRVWVEAEVGSPDCYPNCDHSTAPPILNANDFQCFLNEFASSNSYANCDHSTAPPVLNANDFQCFLNAFAGGCS